MKDAKIDSKLKSWFKYHHYYANPCAENHRDYMNALSKLEVFSDREVIDNGDMNEMWKDMLSMINALSSEQQLNIFKIIK